MSADSVPSSKINIFQSKLYTLIYCRHFRTFSRCAMFDWSDTVFRRRNVTRRRISNTVLQPRYWGSEADSNEVCRLIRCAVISFTFYIIMKWKFTQWWSSLLPISTKRTITSHLISLNAKMTTTYNVGKPGPWQTWRYYRSINFNNWISNDNTHHKQTIKKKSTNSLPIRLHIITNMNDDVNMDSTIAGSLNSCS
jgi:hypothetical protein